ncbi:NDP-hexose 2,3-dehydratase family protein [Crossiella sp. SN42]|uniref:NDP-hexose 2,3-dehydratase family protein n=1 Tax=Crossiella sp. SN42 TaxID=2944808 RepID=UPI00207CD50B|nr:NDP-hexose 2,3-dehydratase family protein [Crossiella sp. SN42]MCO1574621.1 NDP-hexose 2,3-dehydratase family protein [Crossiella sp. SN42]
MTELRAAEAALRGQEPLATAEDFHRWWSQRQRAGRFEVRTVPFDQLDQWDFDPATGNLGHRSGRFFTVEGLLAKDDTGQVRTQPVLHQPEIGVLGILVADLGGRLCCLMQAKWEPGNVNGLQLSPTVQATRSNQQQVHGGAATRYLRHFTDPGPREVLADVLQSEQGAWFWRKRNRNMVVRARGPVPPHEDYRWITLDLLRALLAVDNLVNMDARTVLSCLPPPPGVAGPSVHTRQEILSWFTAARAHCAWQARLVPLSTVDGWSRTPEEIADRRRREFRVVGVRAGAHNREVREWTQPLLEPFGQGMATMVIRQWRGVPHLLVQARVELGLLDLVELGPTVQVAPGQDRPVPLESEPAAAGEVLFDTVLSEEGGRFRHARTRYRIVRVGEDFPLAVPGRFRWLTARQLGGLLRHGHYLNVEGRTLLACFHSLTAPTDG